MREEAADLAELAEAAADPWLRGFWVEDHNVPSGLTLVEGDPVRFERDKELAYERAQRKLDAYAKIRWLIIEEWDRYDFTREAWR